MAEAPEDATIPSVTPQGGEGFDVRGERLSVETPEVHAVSQGISELGKGAEAVSDNYANIALRLAAINNQAGADHAAQTWGYAKGLSDTQFLKDFRSALSANPSLDAPSYLSAYYDKQEGIRAQISAGLPNPMMRQIFDTDTRSQSIRDAKGLAGETATAQTDAITKTLTGTIDGLQSQYQRLDPSDDAGEQAIVGKIASTVKALAANEGVGGDAEVYLYNQAVGKMYEDKIKGYVSANNIPDAEALYDKHKDVFTEDQGVAILGAMKSGAVDLSIQSAANALAQGQAPTIGGAGAHPEYTAALHGREGSGNNPFSSASGQDQFLKGTWLTLLKSNPEFADVIKGKSDAQILALRNDPHLTDEAAVIYGQENAPKLQAAGFATTQANVGLAHGYGPAGAIAILQANQRDPNTPVSSVIGAETALHNGVQGKSVGQVLQGFTTRFGTGQFGDTSQGGQVPPPPRLAPNEDVDQAKADYDKYIDDWWPKVFAGQPQNIDRAKNAAKAQMQTIYEQMHSAQTAARNRLYEAADQQLHQGNPVSEANALKNAYPGAQADLNILPPGGNAQLSRDITYDWNVASPQRDTNYAILDGIRNSNYSAFQAINLTSPKPNTPEYNIDPQQRHTLQTEQLSDRRRQETLSNMSTRWASIKSIPGVQAIIAAQFQQHDDSPISDTPGTNGGADIPSNAHMAFIGALTGEVEKAEARLPQGKKLSDTEITVLANQLMLHPPGFAGHAYTYIPPVDRQQITFEFVRRYGQPPSPEELAEIYHKGQ